MKLSIDVSRDEINALRRISDLDLMTRLGDDALALRAILHEILQGAAIDDGETILIDVEQEQLSNTRYVRL